MNLFILDEDPIKAAAAHADRHVTKMILESAQILSTVTGIGYKPTHENHPVVKWAAESMANALWTWRYGMELGGEYFRRYGKTHKSLIVLIEQGTIYFHGRSELKSKDHTPFVLCMPKEYIVVAGDGVTDPTWSYRNYYRAKNKEWTAKGRPMKWRAPATKPEWMV